MKSKAEGEHYSMPPALFGLAWSVSNAAFHMFPPNNLRLKNAVYKFCHSGIIHKAYLFSVGFDHSLRFCIFFSSDSPLALA